MRKIILSEDKLGIIKENIADIMKNRLPDYVYKSVKEHNTSLGDSPAFPPSHDYNFDYKLLKMRYNEILDALEELGLPTDEEEAENLISKLMVRAIELETPIRPQLNKLVNNVVYEMFAVPSETINLTCELKDKIEPQNALRIVPEDDSDGDDSYEFSDVNEINHVDDIVKQRRFVDALIQGYSTIASQEKDYYAEFFVEKGIDELFQLYDKINALNDYLVFVKKEKIDKKNPQLVSYVAVHLGHGDNKTSIKSQGLIFPYLLKETIRGFMELFSSHGLPEDNHKAQMIIKMADFTMAEPWDIRLGVPLWEHMFLGKIKANMLPYFFSEYCSMGTEEFFEISREILAKTRKGNEYIEASTNDIEHNLQYNEFLKNIQQKNIDASMITDGYMSSDDLDDYTISEDNGDIEENAENEYNTEPLKQFKDYITMSPEQVQDEMLYKYAYKIADYIEQYGWAEDLSDEDWNILEKADDEEDVETMINIINKYPEIKKGFIGYGELMDMGNNEATYNTYSYNKNIDINKEWLIHFTTEPGSIAENGFTRSTPEIDQLSVTHGVDGVEGYNFAFVADCVSNYEAQYYCGRDSDKWGAVMFKANGVEAYHNGDEQNQVIFWGSKARDIVPIYHGDASYYVSDEYQTSDNYGNIDDCWYILDEKHNVALYYCDNIEDMVSWVENNYFQYRRVINVRSNAQMDYNTNTLYRKKHKGNNF